MRYLYSFLFYLAMPLILLRLLWRSRRLPSYRERFLERFGFCSKLTKSCIWVHAVSVGEVLAAVPLVKKLKILYPDTPLLVTNMTPTGASRVKDVFGEKVCQQFIPYDLPGAVARFLNNTKPKVAIILETELWPNLFSACYKRDIPIIITNARLSPKSFKGYQFISPLTRKMLSQVTKMSAQSAYDAELFIKLGVPVDKLTMTGNLKFDIEIPKNLQGKGAVLRSTLGKDRLIWIAASTHLADEDIILKAHQKIKEKIPSALLILVPRHPERFDSVGTQCARYFRTARRSRREALTSDIDVYLGDTMGELLLLYAASDVAFVGGSFAPIGGHNLLEPAVLQKPVLTGPILFNFLEISELLLKAKGLEIVDHADHLSDQVIKLLINADQRQAMGNNAYQVVNENRGALQKQLENILSVMPA